MAYAHGVTREEIFAAATEIFASGKNPTQASVRAQLGKGSFSTISKYLGEWREAQTDAEAVVDNFDEMPEEIKLLLRRTYAAIRAHVEGMVLNEQVALLEEENQALRERTENFDAVIAELEGLKFAYRDAMERIDRLTRDNERLTTTQPEPKQTKRKPRAKAAKPADGSLTDSLNWEDRVNGAVGDL